ncbi:LacI family transcriptional regulator [Brevibacterium sanguinis]|uniref:LacI family transcriptional regulator n=2 Tax=Brevibacterium TaxID=1696 RepID=A0A366IHY7_9MICO|nr:MULTISPECIES: LacI family DNA-binding transcriptional regulator [Brevibacterium]RBP64974.1 LacI family transcriptional regulator [Brevibacterium sanguinis]RBP71237.1 LacI family transcriptional regulator [Brevibacterium celere]
MPRNRAVTLKQVAEHADVSRAAASFALSGRPGVSDATRSKVLRIAAELGYTPNQTAQNLRSSRTGMIAVYLPRYVSTLSYYMEATFGVIDEAELSGHTVTLIPHRRSSLGRLQADGIIVLDPTLDDPMVGQLLDLGLPVVTGEEMPGPRAEVAGRVASDHGTSAVEILDHFAAAGSRRPAIITTGERMSWSMAIEEAYQEWCRAHDVEPRVESANLADIEESTRAATRSLLETGGVDAILALTDGSVLSVITSAAEYGRTVGEDLLVAAAVDSPALGHTDPAVTAVDLHPREFGRRCMAVLRRVLDGEESASGPLAEVVETRVVYRASTAGPGTAGR